MFPRLALFALLALAGCAGGSDRAAEPPATGPDRAPGVALEGVTLTETADGEKAWELEADAVDYRQPEGLAELRNVKARFFEDGGPVSTGEAPRAVFHMSDRRLRLLGGIRVEAEGGEAGFTAHEVTWLPAEGKLAAKGDVSFRRGANTLTGATLDADRRLQTVHLAGGVRGQAKLDLAGTSAPLSASTP